MDQNAREILRSKINQLIQETEHSLNLLDEGTKPISPENSIGRVSRMDAINNKGVADASKSSQLKKLSQLKIALSKIDDPKFGICENCNEVIQEGRLMYMPQSQFCVRCASKH